MASASVMPCCVVLRRLSLDMSTDDASGKRVCALSTSAQTEKGTGSATSASATSSKERYGTTKTRNEKVFLHSKFKEPRARVLLSANSVRRVKKAQNLASSDNDIALSISEDKGETQHSNPEIIRLCSSSGSDSRKTESNVAENQGKSHLSRCLPGPSKRRRKRASSVEWDWSGSESTDTSKVPQSKWTKSSTRRKRKSSVDSEYNDRGNESDSSITANDNKQEHSNHTCYLCDKKFRRPWRLRVHLHQHINPNDRQFVCDEEGCSKSYFKKQHLDRHKSTSHSNLVFVTNVMCEGCKKVFATASGLKRHMSKIHSEENFKFQCPTCDKKFSKTKQLRFHMAEHEGQPPLRCNICNAGAYSNAALKRHARTHKTYDCDVPGCEQTFSNYSTHRKHVAEHNRCFKSLKCAHCGKVCSSTQNLRAHVETHLESKEVFRCPYKSCPRFYYQKRNLTSHIQVRHEKTSQFKCDKVDCDKIFMNRRAFARHLNNHENGKAPITRKKEGRRATRKDAGKPRRAMACKLTGIMIPPELEKELLISDHPCIKSESEIEEENASETLARIPTVASVVDKLECSGSSLPSCMETVNEREEIISPLGEKDCANSMVEEPQENEEVEPQENEEVEPQENEEVEPQKNEEVEPQENEHVENTSGECDVSVLKTPQNSDLVLDYKSADSSDTSLHQTALLINDTEGIISNLVGKVFQISEEGELMEIHKDLQQEGVSSETAVNPSAFLLHDKTTTTESLRKSDFNSSSESCNPIVESQNIAVKSSNSYCSTRESKQDTGKTSLASHFVLPFPMNQSFGSSANCMSTNMLSATLCAQAIVEVPLSCPESEVLLVVPKLSGNIVNEMNTEAVIKALTGDAEVYSVADRNTSKTLLAGLLQNYGNQSSSQEIIKKISLNDPSVSSILKPLIKSLENEKPSDTSHNAESPCIIPLSLEGKEKIYEPFLNEDKSVNELIPRSQPETEALKVVPASEKENFPSIQEKDKIFENTSAMEMIKPSTPSEVSPLERDITSVSSHSSKCSHEIKGLSSASGGHLKQKIFFNPAHISRKEGKKKSVATISTGHSDQGNETTFANQSCSRQIFHNPAYIEKGIKNFADLTARFFPIPEKHKSSKGHLQGPSEDSVESDNSTSSESEDNNDSEDSNSGDTDSNYDVIDSSEDGAGDSDGNGDDEEEEEEDADEQPEDEENVEEDDDDDDNEENGNNNGPNEINEGNDDNNNSNDNAEDLNSQDSERRIDYDADNDQNVDHGSDFGIDRSVQTKCSEELYKSDGGNSSRSDNLIIVTDETEREANEWSIESPSNVAALPRMSHLETGCQSKGPTEATLNSLPQKNLTISQKVNSQHDPSNIDKCNGSKLIRKSKPKKKKLRRLNAISQWNTSESSDNEPLSKWLANHKDFVPALNSKTKRAQQNSHRDSKDINNKRTYQKRKTCFPTVKTTKQKSKNSDNTDEFELSSDFEPKKKRVRPLDSSSDSDLSEQKPKMESSCSDQDESCISEQEHARKRNFNFNVSDDSDDPADPTWKPTKKEDSDSSYELELQSRKELAKPEHISVNPSEALMMSPLSPTQDPLNLSAKEEFSSGQEAFKKPLRSGLACSQLSESAWINVLRQVSKTLKLSPSVVE